MSMAWSVAKVTGADVYNQDVVIQRKGVAHTTPGASREVITEFSKESRQRLAFVASNTGATFTTMVTLTYPQEWPTDGTRVKQHLHTFLQTWRNKYSRTYLWFLEFQKRGAPHVHILSGYALPGRQDDRQQVYQDVADAWFQIVDSGDPLHLAAGTRVERVRKPDGAKHYAVKYALKMYQKQVPAEYQSVGRFWGCSKDVAPVPTMTVQCTADDVMAVTMGLPFAPKDADHIWSVLYGKADAFRRWADPER